MKNLSLKILYNKELNNDYCGIETLRNIKSLDRANEIYRNRQRKINTKTLGVLDTVTECVYKDSNGNEHKIK